MTLRTFTLAASNAAGTVQASANVTVADPPPPTVIGIGARVKVIKTPSMNIFSAASLSSTNLGQQPTDAQGVVVAGPTASMWQVDFDTGVDGWAWGTSLALATGVPPPPPPPPTGEVITINPAVKFQTMEGWEAHARAWEENKAANAYDPSWRANCDLIAGALVNSLGLNRIQIPLRSGWINPTDYWAQFVAGTLSYSAWDVKRYEKIKGAIQFSEFDFRVETMVQPLAAALAARGEKLYVNLGVVDFGGPGSTAGVSKYEQGDFNLSSDPIQYGDFVLACFNRLKTKYGITADALELNNEPENSSWSGAQMGAALSQAKAKLSAAGYTVNYIGPSPSSAGRMIGYADQILAVAPLTTLSFHRYDGPGTATIGGLNTYAKSKNLKLSMTEWTSATSDTLLEDLIVGNVSCWQKWALAGRLGVGSTPQGFYVLGDTNVTPLAITMAPNSAKLTAIMRYVRFGATRIAATSGNAARVLVAFVNANGKHVVVVKSATADAVTISGLPAGVYGVHRVDTSDVATDLPDVTVSGNLAITCNPGLTTIYGR